MAHTRDAAVLVLGGKNVDPMVCFFAIFSRRHDTPLTEWHISLVYWDSEALLIVCWSAILRQSLLGSWTSKLVEWI